MIKGTLAKLVEAGAVGLKAEFEAEGATPEEVLALKSLGSRFGLPLTLKISGCEALSEFRWATRNGVSRIVAPMIESSFAAEKFARVVRLHGESDTRFGINVETTLALQHLESIGEAVVGDRRFEVDFVFGRVDYVESLGLDRGAVNSDQVREAGLRIAKEAQTRGQSFGVGGSISAESQGFIRSLLDSGLSFFETRKVVFPGRVAEKENFSAVIQLAHRFEMEWLSERRGLNPDARSEDEKRARILQERLG